jgi:alpha-glucosidase (family GH31 glycosyl hydrolase)
LELQALKRETRRRFDEIGYKLQMNDERKEWIAFNKKEDRQFRFKVEKVRDKPIHFFKVVMCADVEPVLWTELLWVFNECAQMGKFVFLVVYLPETEKKENHELMIKHSFIRDQKTGISYIDYKGREDFEQAIYSICYYPKIKDMVLEMQEVTAEIHKKDPTITFKGVGTSGLVAYSIYCYGKECNVDLKLKEEKFILKIAEVEYELAEKTEISPFVAKNIEQTKKERRLLNLYKPPTRHFEEVFSKIKNRLTSDLKVLMYQVLLSRYTAEEIEFHCSTHKTSCREVQTIYNKKLIVITKVIDIYFIIAGSEIASETNKDKAFEIFANKISEKNNEEIKEHLLKLLKNFE